jgi:hypothetical protein
MEGTESTVEEFGRRRSATWRAVRWWLLTLVFAGVYFAYRANQDPTDFNVPTMVSFVLMMGSLLAAIFAINRRYRCPRCEMVPMMDSKSVGLDSFSFERGVDLSPSVCGNCGARLKHRKPSTRGQPIKREPNCKFFTS